MRLIDADELKKKLLKIQAGIVNEEVPRGNTKSDAWTLAYMLILDEYIKMLDEMPSVINGCNADAILDAYGKGYSKGREDVLSEVQLMKDYCKNDCDALRDALRDSLCNSFCDALCNSLRDSQLEYTY